MFCLFMLVFAVVLWLWFHAVSNYFWLLMYVSMCYVPRTFINFVKLVQLTQILSIKMT